MKKLIAFLAISLLYSCTNNEGTERALRGAGYTDIELTGHAFWGCADSDDTCTGFRATGPNGHEVEGAVGCGYNTGCSKGCTIRTK